ncbi:hypothetical protein [Streptomyces sp. NPDC056938]|uniref:hypothetical protein n=1 Tax=unclassified Streptomyces TaxID=2593676 RepID=UPI0036447F1E
MLRLFAAMCAKASCTARACCHAARDAASGSRRAMASATHRRLDGTPMLLLAALCVAMGVAGAGRDRQLDDEHTASTLAAGALAPSGQEHAPAPGR